VFFAGEVHGTNIAAGPGDGLAVAEGKAGASFVGSTGFVRADRPDSKPAGVDEVRCAAAMGREVLRLAQTSPRFLLGELNAVVHGLQGHKGNQHWSPESGVLPLDDLPAVARKKTNRSAFPIGGAATILPT